MARTQVVLLAPIFVLRSWLDDQTMMSQSLMVMTPLGEIFPWINTLIYVEFQWKNNWALLLFICRAWQYPGFRCPNIIPHSVLGIN